MTGLLHAHSGLRFLVLLVALAHVVLSLVGQVQGQPVKPVHRALSAAFMGLLHTQVLLGIALVLMGLYYPQLIGHLVLMLAAATCATVMHVLNKRAATPNHRRALIGTGGALLLIVAAIAAIGRHPFEMRVMGGG